MVRTDEFSLNRFRGDAEKAEAVYAGVPEPLTADDIADVVGWVATRPSTSTSTRSWCVPSPRRPAQGAPGRLTSATRADHRARRRDELGEQRGLLPRPQPRGAAAAGRTVVAATGAEHRGLRRADEPRGDRALGPDRRAARGRRARGRARGRGLPAAVHDDVPPGGRPGRGRRRHPAAAPRRRGGRRLPRAGRHDRRPHRHPGRHVGRLLRRAAGPARRHRDHARRRSTTTG